MSAIACIEDLRKKAKKRVPRMFYDYADGGSWSESTYRANEDDLQAMKFRQRVAIDVNRRDTGMEMLGKKVTMPVALAPTGLTGMLHADGEILAAKAAADFGVPFTLSTMSICSIEDVAANSDAPFWFQLYVMRDREFIRRLVERTRAANCSALMITLDLQIMGQRHKDVRNGLSAPPKPTLRNLINLIQKPAWCLGMMGTKRRQFGNIVGHVKGVKDVSSLADWTVSQFDASLSWEDVKEIRKQWDGKVIIKGILDAEDARNAVNVGADAIVVSNHGGRQLDGTISSIMGLKNVISDVAPNLEVFFDGGIRSGKDIVKALALGAKGVFMGRPYLYGLGSFGQKGVEKVIEILVKELNTTLLLAGETNVDDLNNGNLY